VSHSPGRRGKKGRAIPTSFHHRKLQGSKKYHLLRTYPLTFSHHGRRYTEGDLEQGLQDDSSHARELPQRSDNPSQKNPTTIKQKKANAPNTCRPTRPRRSHRRQRRIQRRPLLLRHGVRKAGLRHGNGPPLPPLHPNSPTKSGLPQAPHPRKNPAAKNNAHPLRATSSASPAPAPS